MTITFRADRSGSSFNTDPFACGQPFQKHTQKYIHAHTNSNGVSLDFMMDLGWIWEKPEWAQNSFGPKFQSWAVA